MRFKRLLIGVAAATAAVGIGAGGLCVLVGVRLRSGHGAGAVAQTLTVNPETPPVPTRRSSLAGPPARSTSRSRTRTHTPSRSQRVSLEFADVDQLTGQCASSNISVDRERSDQRAHASPSPANTTSPLKLIPGVLDLATTAPPGARQSPST